MEDYTQTILDAYEGKMEKALEAMENDFASMRAGRANPHVLDKIRVDYYGAPTPIQSVANISVPEARTILIQPFEKNMLKAIERAINSSDVGINPIDDGNSIRLIFPELTEERRKDLVKDVKKRGESAKVSIRNARRDANESVKKLEKDGEISENERDKSLTRIQKMHDKMIDKVDRSVEAKSKELMTV